MGTQYRGFSHRGSALAMNCGAVRSQPCTGHCAGALLVVRVMLYSCAVFETMIKR